MVSKLINGPFPQDSGVKQMLVDAGDGSFAPQFAIIDGYQAPIAQTWTNATPLNTVLSAITSGYDTVVVSLVATGTVSGGVVTAEIYDGAAWLPVKLFSMDAYTSFLTVTLATGLNKGYQADIAGFPQFRLRLSTVISGAGSITATLVTSSAPSVPGCCVGVESLPALVAGSAAIGDVGLQYRANATGGSQPGQYYSPASTAPTSIKAGAGRSLHMLIKSNAASNRFLKVFNTLVGSITMGTTAATYDIEVGPGERVTVGPLEGGVAHGNAICLATTAAAGLTDNTATGLASNDLIVTLFYA